MNKIKSTWTYQHKQLIVILSLIVVVLIQAFPFEFPKKVIAYESVDSVELTPEALLKKYTLEMHESMYAEAEIRATRRLFDELSVVVEELNPSN